MDAKVIFITGSKLPATPARIQRDHPAAVLFKPVSLKPSSVVIRASRAIDELDHDLRWMPFGGLVNFVGDIRGRRGVHADSDAASGAAHRLRRSDLANRRFEGASTLRTLQRDDPGVGVFQ